MTDFEEVYQEHFKTVHLYLLALCKDPALAEELTADVFFKALKALPNFRGDCDIQTWLCAMGRNTWISHLRKSERNVSLEELSIPDPSASIEEQVADKQLAMQVHRILHTLPEPYKEVFSLRVFGQLSFQDIGALFEKNANWACVTYHRARRRIQQAMEVV
ncbi:MAG: sigma-70 family RNA polymerase sigma factor [Oscillospiraceae bacterium]|nr:sigma-70 family RNA polymerase sigma factor [Oscillospiraceae bacterium]